MVCLQLRWPCPGKSFPSRLSFRPPRHMLDVVDSRCCSDLMLSGLVSVSLSHSYSPFLYIPGLSASVTPGPSVLLVLFVSPYPPLAATYLLPPASAMFHTTIPSSLTTNFHDRSCDIGDFKRISWRRRLVVPPPFIFTVYRCSYLPKQS